MLTGTNPVMGLKGQAAVSAAALGAVSPQASEDAPPGGTPPTEVIMRELHFTSGRKTSVVPQQLQQQQVDTGGGGSSRASLCVHCIAIRGVCLGSLLTGACLACNAPLTAGSAEPGAA